MTKAVLECLPAQQEANASNSAPKGALVHLNVISHQFMYKSRDDGLNQLEINSFIDNHILMLDSDPLVRALFKRVSKKFPIKSLNSMLLCGEVLGSMEIKCSNGCSSYRVPYVYHCSRKTCPVCSKFRQDRVLKKYLPKFEKQKYSQSKQLTFITISPEHSLTFEEGHKAVINGFYNLRRNKWFKSRSDFGCYSIETKTLNQFGEAKGIHTHMHILNYGGYLDNRIRGKCLDCGQNLMDYDKESKVFSCASSKCRSLNVKIKHKDSKLVREVKKAFGKNVIVDVRGVCDGYKNRDVRKPLKYFTKYITYDKSNFASIDDQADFIVFSSKHKNIVWFGRSITISVFRWVCLGCHTQIKAHRPEMGVFIEQLINPSPNKDEVVF